MTRFLIPALLAGLTLLVMGPAQAEPQDLPAVDSQDSEQSWYYQPSTSYQPNPRAIIHEKAMARAQQRARRLASLQWYGMSNSRPTASPTPFTSMYSPAWQTPGGRPYAWYTSGRPTFVFR